MRLAGDRVREVAEGPIKRLDAVGGARLLVEGGGPRGVREGCANSSGGTERRPQPFDDVEVFLRTALRQQPCGDERVFYIERRLVMGRG